MNTLAQTRLLVWAASFGRDAGLLGYETFEKWCPNSKERCNSMLSGTMRGQEERFLSTRSLYLTAQALWIF